MKLNQIIITTALVFSANLAQAYETVELSSSPTWGGTKQHHADLVVWFDAAHVYGMPPSVASPTIIPVEVNIAKPNGTPWPLQAQGCGSTIGKTIESSVNFNQRQEVNLIPGSYCRFRVTLDTSEAVIANIQLQPGPDTTANAANHYVRASLELRDINDNPLARSELR